MILPSVGFESRNGEYRRIAQCAVIRPFAGCKYKAMRYERTPGKEQQLREEVDKLLVLAAQVDAEEDGKYGKGK